MDAGRVINGLEQFIADFKPFCGSKADWQRVYEALALLKAQEPIAPKRVVRGVIVQWRCGACDARLGDCLMGDIDNYCRHCGRAVKW